MTDNPSKRINVNKTENTVTFNITIEFYVELSTPETNKLFRSTKIKITRDKNGKNVPHWEITEVVLVDSKILSNYYQHDLRVLYTFVPKKSFGQLLDILPKNFIFLNTFNLKLWHINLWLTDEIFKTLKMK